MSPPLRLLPLLTISLFSVACSDPIIGAWEHNFVSETGSATRRFEFEANGDCSYTQTVGRLSTQFLYEWQREEKNLYHINEPGCPLSGATPDNDADCGAPTKCSLSDDQESLTCEEWGFVYERVDD